MSAARVLSTLAGASSRQRMLLGACGVLALPAVASAVTYTPAQIRTAYGFNAVPATGAGQTISIIDFGEDATAVSDLNTFDSTFGINAPASFSVVDQSGGGQAATAGEVIETSLDIEYAHAIAPGASIVLIEVPNTATATSQQIITAANTAASRGAVVSMSFGEPGGVNQTGITPTSNFDAAFNHAGVTFVASSGDSGGLEYPASSPNVVGVGGTNLQVNSDYTYGSETVWNNYVAATKTTPESGGSSGGGVDSGETIPAYQVGVATGPYRNTPDVAYDADPNTGFYIVAGGVEYGNVGGTSAGAPQWAGLFALADQERAALGESPLSSTQALSMLYAAYSNKLLYAELFHDVTTGTNQTGISANVGYDDVTGLGTPIANNVVAYLVGGATAVPEPASLGLVSVAGLMLARRRKMV